MRIIIDGQSVRAVNLNDAPGRAVIALQQQSGLGIDDIVAMNGDKTKQTLITKIVEFLSEHNRGRYLTWDEVLDKPIPQIEADPGDPGVRDAEPTQGEAEDPTSASTASPSVDAAAAPSAPPVVTRASLSSTATSDGSTTRSTPDSSTS
ncbi:hypothetical protein [Cellulosimicrobium sp. 22601]|uniref:hypothetical protein n=1 Tax=unclassified Cellulosimicrobium TaxID=2624466 RepID=UPI003F869DAD